MINACCHGDSVMYSQRGYSRFQDVWLGASQVKNDTWETSIKKYSKTAIGKAPRLDFKASILTFAIDHCDTLKQIIELLILFAQYFFENYLFQFVSNAGIWEFVGQCHSSIFDLRSCISRLWQLSHRRLTLLIFDEMPFFFAQQIISHMKTVIFRNRRAFFWKWGVSQHLTFICFKM